MYNAVMTNESAVVEELEAPSTALQEIGQRLRSFRLMHGWTLDGLATRAKLSKSYISRLEDGDRQPSIASLLSLSRALGVSLGSLLSNEAQIRNAHVIRGADIQYVPGNGLAYQVHSGRLPGAVMQPLRITISASRTGDDLYRHDGEEWIYVLSGQLTVDLGDERHVLESGDSIHFDATIGHRLSANGADNVEAILVASATPKSLLSSYI
jgi:transcriptional regulator with XRE-family HTH domain